MQHKHAHDHQQVYEIMIIVAATQHNIRLIVGTNVMLNMGIAYYIQHNAQSTPLHYGFSLLISVDLSVCM